MNEDVRIRCLEPFFSTKGEKGTGLGLSMVFGIIKRHNGTLDIESAVDRGSTFRIRLPAEIGA
jgi:signal transduction histidine kinase